METQWDCRSFNAAAYKEEILRQRAERFSTMFAVTFLSEVDPRTGQLEQFLAAAYSTGHIKLFRIKDAVSSWLSRSTSANACLCWEAHSSAVTSLHRQSPGTPSALLISGADDGTIRAWSLPTLLQHNQPSQPSNGHAGPSTQAPLPATSLPATLEGQLPGVAVGGVIPPPGINCMALDAGSGRLYVGITDGNSHVYDLQAALNSPPSKSTGSRAIPCVASLAGHLSGVLSIDVCPQTGLVATGSEDGMVRMFSVGHLAAGDATALPTVLQPSQTICPSQGSVVPPHPAAQLQVAWSASPVTAVRFQDGGWVVCGLSGSTPELALWSLDASVLAMHVPLPCVPQAMLVLPGEILVAGTEPTLFRYTFTGQLAAQHELDSSARSIFSLDVLPGNPAGEHKAGSIAPGAIALGGSRGSCVLLSRSGTQLAVFHPSSLED